MEESNVTSEVLDLFQGNVYEEYNDESGFGVFNMFLNSSNQLRSFHGYEAVKNESFATGKYLARLITRDGKVLIIADNSGVIVLQYNQATKDVVQILPKLFFENVRNQNLLNAQIWNPNPNGYSMVENQQGVIFITDGSVGGLYVLYLRYLPNGEIDQNVFFQQFPYQSIVALDPSTNTTPVENGNIVQMVRPSKLAYLNTHIIVVDYAKGGMNVLDGVSIDNNGNPLNNPIDFDNVVVSYEITIQTKPCNIVSVAVIGQFLQVIGTKCIETWFSDSSIRPIRKYPNVLQEIGSNLPRCIVEFNEKLIFIGSSDDRQYQLYVWDGKADKPIAIRKGNLNYLFTKIQNFDDISLTVFGTFGQEFTIINFGGKTGFNFSVLVNIETQDSFYIVDNYQGKESRFLADDIFKFNNQYFFISWNINRLYKFDDKLTTYNGNPIKCSVRTRQAGSKSGRLISLSDCNVVFARIPEYYYNEFDTDCIPVLQKNTNIAIRFFVKTRKNTWNQFCNGFFQINRQTFHRIFPGSFTVQYNPQLIIEFFQASSIEPFSVKSSIQNLKLNYFPIILNSLQITIEEL